MVAYSDFLIVAMAATALQIGALVYLAKIHKTIGRCSTIDYAWTNGLMLVYNLLVDYLLVYVTPNRPNAALIEIWGVYLAAIFPIGMSIGNIRQMRRLYKALRPNVIDKGKSNEQRDTARDVNRDIERDSVRDRDRDYRRDLHRDQDEDKRHNNDDDNGNNP